MEEKILDRSITILEKILYICMFVYLFLLIFPHTVTIRGLAFWTAIPCWVALRIKRKDPFISLNPITVSLLLFVALALVSSVIGTEPLGNLRRFKGEVFPILILFLIASTEYGSIEKVKKLFIAPVASFALHSFLIIIESLDYGLRYYWDRGFRHNNMLLDGYGQIGITIIPITLGISLLVKNSRWKMLLLIVSLVEFCIIAPYSFTPAVSVCSALLLFALFAQPKKIRFIMLGVISVVIVVVVLIFTVYKDNRAVTEIKDRLYFATHPIEEMNKDEGFSYRNMLWKVYMDVMKDKPVLGYGWGIKKFKKILLEKKFSDKWKTTNTHIYHFLFVQEKDKFYPPHNLFLEIGLQSGLLGLISFIIFIGIYTFYLIRSITYRIGETDRNFSIILIGGTLLSFMIMNLMNNELGNVSGEILFVALGGGAAWIKNNDSHRELKS